MPLANRTTPANGDERAQVVPLLDAVKVHTGKRGRPRKRLKVIATDKGYDAKTLRQQLRKRGYPGTAAQAGLEEQEKTAADRLKKFQAERILAWFQKKYYRLVGRAARRLWRSLRSISGSID